MTTWSINWYTRRHMPTELNGNMDEIERQVVNLAGRGRRALRHPLEVEGYTDQIDFFYRDGGKRRRYATAMAEG